ncbi:SH2 domain protein A, putative isoform 2 [Hibiscus syriacus]|uniref:SH2 domain protein A, putative isoform 2 n=1 Tax=Hibiscus syriacus TaxID=106335 RepID=A0A6A3AJK7_HIBSY|nr:SH2 domain protein A, putative isoform 2 [Hibiscus syriacus]
MGTYVEVKSKSSLEYSLLISQNTRQASRRRIFSLDVVLLDIFGQSVNKELEVVASLLYAFNWLPVKKINGEEPPLLVSCDGIEFASSDRPNKLSKGRASFKLKISKVVLSGNGFQSFGLDYISCEPKHNTVDEAELSPTSKRVGLGEAKISNIDQHSEECNTIISNHNQAENGFGSRSEARVESFEEVNTSLPDSGITGAHDSALKGVSIRGHSVSDVTTFRYCLGGLTDRSLLLKEIATVSNEEISGFAEQVSVYSGCSHHSGRIKAMWNSTSPKWIEGFITKEEAELSLQDPRGLHEPGTFILRFPTSRSWPHPDAGSLVVTYVGSDYTIHHRLLSLDNAIYVASLIGTALAWQICTVGVVGLVYLVSSLYSNVVSMLSFPFVPVVGVVLYGEKMDAVKFKSFSCTPSAVPQNYVRRAYLKHTTKRKPPKDRLWACILRPITATRLYWRESITNRSNRTLKVDTVESHYDSCASGKRSGITGVI